MGEVTHVVGQDPSSSMPEALTDASAPPVKGGRTLTDGDDWEG